MGRKRENNAAERYRIGDLTLDAGLQQVQRDGEAIELPRLSFDLLLELARAAPNYLSTDELIDRVWNGVVVNRETVSKRVELVRSAIGDDSHDPKYIALVRDRGYRLIAPVEQLSPDPAGLAKARTHVLAAAAVAAVAAVVTGFYVSRDETPGETAGDHVLVLPFRNAGGDSLQYIADGLTGTLIDRLWTVPGVRTFSRDTVFAFADSTESPIDIGRKLNASLVLFGTVSQPDERHVAVSAEILEVGGGDNTWSKTLVREDDGSWFEILDVLAVAVISRIDVDAARQFALRQYGTVDDKAFDGYLRGRHLYNRRHTAGLEQAVRLFREAAKTDPGYLAAHTAIVDAYAAMNVFGDLPGGEAARLSEPSASAAVRIAPGSAEALTALAQLNWLRGNAALALSNLQKALEVDDSYLPALHKIVQVLSESEVLLESKLVEEYVERAYRLDPYNERTIVFYAFMHWNDGQVEQGFNIVRTLLSVRPNAAWAARLMVSAYGSFGDGVEALRWGQRAVAFDPEDANSRISYAFALAVLGDFDAVGDEFERLTRRNLVSTMTLNWLTYLHLMNTGDSSRVRAAIDRYIEDHPETLDAGNESIDTRRLLHVAGKVAALDGDFDEARIYLERADDIDSPMIYGEADVMDLLTYLAISYREVGDEQGAAEVLQRLHDMRSGISGFETRRAREKLRDDWRGWPLSPYLWAAVSAVEGDRERTIFLLRLAESNGWPFYEFVQTEPAFESLRDDPEVREIVRRIKTRVDRMREEAEKSGLL